MAAEEQAGGMWNLRGSDLLLMVVKMKQGDHPRVNKWWWLPKPRNKPKLADMKQTKTSALQSQGMKFCQLNE